MLVGLIINGVRVTDRDQTYKTSINEVIDWLFKTLLTYQEVDSFLFWSLIFEPHHEKNNSVVSNQVRHRAVQAQKMARGWKFWI